MALLAVLGAFARIASTPARTVMRGGAEGGSECRDDEARSLVLKGPAQCHSVVSAAWKWTATRTTRMQNIASSTPFRAIPHRARRG